MFDKFGYISSTQAFNDLAENLINENDIESLKALAAENGIDEAFVEMYIAGDIPVLADTASFAIGKLDVEAKELKTAEIMLDWIEYVKSLVMDNDVVACAVRQEDKTLAGMIAEILNWSFRHQVEVPKDVMKAAGVNASKCTLGIPGMATVKKLIREYYGG